MTYDQEYAGLAHPAKKRRPEDHARLVANGHYAARVLAAEGYDGAAR